MRSLLVRRAATLALATGLFAGVVAIQADAPVQAGGECDPGDDRADCVPGNAVRCNEFTASGGPIVNPPVDADFQFPAPADQSGGSASGPQAVAPFDIVGVSDGQFLDVTAGPGITIVAVIVKGGDAYNIYAGLGSYTDLHSPLVGMGNIPDISHWFVCYNGGTPPPPPPPPPPVPPEPIEVVTQPTFTG